MTSSVWSEHRFISFDETPIFYRRLRLQAPAACLLITHGMGEHGGRYRALAEYLAGAGVESVIPDLRGFGQSGGKRACVRRFSEYLEDLAALHAFIVSENGQKPLFFLGHSFGGLVASSYLASRSRSRADGLVLSSPIFGIATPVSLWRHWLGLLTARVAPDLTQPTGIPTKFLTHDAEIVQAYEKDPLVYRRISSRLYRELIREIAGRRTIARRLSLPVLLLQSGEDRVVSREAALRFYSELSSEHKEFEVFEGWYHEVLNELERDRVYSRIASWISHHIHHK